MKDVYLMSSYHIMGVLEELEADISLHIEACDYGVRVFCPV